MIIIEIEIAMMIDRNCLFFKNNLFLLRGSFLKVVRSFSRCILIFTMMNDFSQISADVHVHDDSLLTFL